MTTDTSFLFCRFSHRIPTFSPKATPMAGQTSIPTLPRKQKKPDFRRASRSGWQDSNLRPPHPKCGAIPGYATPRKGITFFCGHKYTFKKNHCQPTDYIKILKH